jgi:hypothetical protein
MVDAEVQNIIDQEHLKILSIAYLVSGATNAFFSLFGLLYAFMGVFMGSMMSAIPNRPGQAPPPEFIGWFFGLFGLGFFVLMMTFGILKFVASRRLKQHRSRIFCMIVAGLSCVEIPYGTLLGIFTFMVLSRPSIMQRFSGNEPR